MKTMLLELAAIALAACASPAGETSQIEATWDVQANVLHCYPMPAASGGPVRTDLAPTFDPNLTTTLDPDDVVTTLHHRCEWTCAEYQGAAGQHVTLTFAYAWDPDPWTTTWRLEAEEVTSGCQ